MATGPYIVAGDDPMTVHAAMAETMDTILDEVAEIKARARSGSETRPTWPMIILRTPKGWTGPKEVDGKPTEGTWRSHQVPLVGRPPRPGASRPARGLAAVLPTGRAVRRRRATGPRHPRLHAGRLATDECQPARQRRPAPAGPQAAGLPGLRRHGGRAGRRHQRGDPGPRDLAARRDPGQPHDVPALRPGRDRVQPAGRRVRGDRPGLDGRDPADGRAPGARVVACSRCCRSTSARAGWRATC